VDDGRPGGGMLLPSFRDQLQSCAGRGVVAFERAFFQKKQEGFGTSFDATFSNSRLFA
jgi:hypothetical protein